MDDFVLLLKQKGNKGLVDVYVTCLCNKADFHFCLLLILFRQSPSSSYIPNLEKQN